MDVQKSQVAAVFRNCVEAIKNDKLIRREDKADKEFHFQNWFKNSLDDLGINYDEPGRNTYPDFRLVNTSEGFELKGLAYPGREADYDCNSQVPCGEHNGREIYYVFGRYPAKPDGNEYPVLDFVMCHGSFLNANSEYVHKNKSFRGFGTFGDILIRDRKMYVAPTPFALADGTAHKRTLITPYEQSSNSELIEIGEIVRKEVAQMVVAYSFNLETNELTTELKDNPNASKEHKFKVYRLQGDPVNDIKLCERVR